MSGIKKGQRITAEWFGDAKFVSLSGMMMKVQATKMEVTGVICHVRGDHQVNPQTVRIYVDPDHPWDGPTTHPYGCTCDHGHVEVNPDHIIGVS